ncbi:hypothetical protein HCR18_05850 [Wolbachia pipientis]|uniref:hypothetical protein n=1 Tax=Wolbachia pipientis TaxID=955 RepID=UPI0015FD9D06|nr:hypothetical protein [Wolbachia pipientis]MBA8758524.1 hypothetical protein [Wolbachia pipientis]MBA8770458.1 hypothetical protein [Wolbachia pipientis]
MTTNNSIQNSAQNLARAVNREEKPIINKIESIIFTAKGTSYAESQLKQLAPFSHVQNIVGKVTDSINSNVIDTLNTVLEAERTKVITLISKVGDETGGLIKEINDLKSSLEPPPMDAPEFPEFI